MYQFCTKTKRVHLLAVFLGHIGHRHDRDVLDNSVTDLSYARLLLTLCVAVSDWTGEWGQVTANTEA